MLPMENREEISIGGYYIFFWYSVEDRKKFGLTKLASAIRGIAEKMKGTSKHVSLKA